MSVGGRLRCAAGIGYACRLHLQPFGVGERLYEHATGEEVGTDALQVYRITAAQDEARFEHAVSQAVTASQRNLRWM